ncbi:hypothetical protein B7P43_G10943 [Cryptotermes secundus]|uniref:Mos1 transposase HTH domain-containing protein n=1 Tax=Cryptotermes secundus TaxID=105785 RepID=A0A2J7Q9S6_9NEOP|nr:hypothetical protein B7P43_G10943 [Cryptotermes secundus]
MATVFWDRKRVLMLEFMQQRTTITSEVYHKMLKKVLRANHSEQKAYNADVWCTHSASP